MNHDEDHGGRTFDLVISSGYDRRLPPSFVDRYQDKIINLHAARLPWGRGIGTTLFALLLDYPLGVSIHFIDSGLDTGDLIAESDVEPTNEDTLRTVYTSMLEETNLLFDSALKSLLAGTASRREQQEIPQRAFARSRADFEDVMKIMPNGYDTALVDVKSLGNSMRALHSARRWLGEQV
jgi:folate-dependent phosphoribosylglycinamide formyltransferase PurN